MNIQEKYSCFTKIDLMSVSGAENLLRAAKKRIATKETWTKKELFRDKDNKPCVYDEDKVCKFCAVGAIESMRMRAYQGIATRYMQLAIEALYLTSGIAYINDTLGFDAVHNVFQVAIDMANEDLAELFAKQQEEDRDVLRHQVQ